MHLEFDIQEVDILRPIVHTEQDNASDDPKPGFDIKEPGGGDVQPTEEVYAGIVE